MRLTACFDKLNNRCVFACEDAFAQKDILKGIGFHWNPNAKEWQKFYNTPAELTRILMETMLRCDCPVEVYDDFCTRSCNYKQLETIGDISAWDREYLAEFCKKYDLSVDDGEEESTAAENQESTEETDVAEDRGSTEETTTDETTRSEEMKYAVDQTNGREGMRSYFDTLEEALAYIKSLPVKDFAVDCFFVRPLKTELRKHHGGIYYQPCGFLFSMEKGEIVDVAEDFTFPETSDFAPEGTK